MKITTRIKNFIFLWRENRKVTVNKDLNIENMLRVTKASYKTKGCLIRNLAASVIRKVRKEKPYVIQDYSKAKALYDSITPIDLSKVKAGDFVFKFSQEEPVKGDRWCEYYINQCGGEGIYKVHRNNGSYFSLATYKGEWNHFTVLKEGSARSFRFATKEEIKEFKNRQKEYKQKKELIAKKQEEISKLYREL